MTVTVRNSLIHRQLAILAGMSSAVLPLLAAAAALIPSNSSARLTPSLVQGSAVASATILPAERVDWSAPPRPLVVRVGPRGEIRHDVEFE